MMKYFAIYGLSLVSLSRSSTLDELSQKANDLLASSGETARTITQADMATLNEYGCWCYFEGDHGKGKGHAVDEFDGICKTLHDGYDCIIRDGLLDNDSGDACIPWDVSYSSSMFLGMDIEEVQTDCEDKNPTGSCNEAVCKFEGWFIAQYLRKVLNGAQQNPMNQHSEGFVVREECPTHAGMASEKQCCGSFPVRFPFKSYGGLRDCCANKTYNTQIYQCCNDGRVRDTC